MTITPSEEEQERQAVQSFYDAFNSHDFSRVMEFATEDWTHINPLGGWARGRDAVLRELKEAHSIFLKVIVQRRRPIPYRQARR